MDIALGGQGAPIVPMGEKLLLGDFQYLLNIGGIANISYRNGDDYIAFDVCPANRVLNMLASLDGRPYDENGNMASSGKVMEDILDRLNSLEYYKQTYPKSLANEFGTETVYSMIPSSNPADALRTYTEHIAQQVQFAIKSVNGPAGAQLLVTGGGAHNTFLIERIRALLEPMGVQLVVPDKHLVDFKEALIMALLGILRWREQDTVMASVTGAKRNSIGGAVWIGQES